MVDAQHLDPLDRIPVRTTLYQVVQFAELLHVVLDIDRSIVGPVVHNSVPADQSISLSASDIIIYSKCFLHMQPMRGVAADDVQ